MSPRPYAEGPNADSMEFTTFTLIAFKIELCMRSLEAREPESLERALGSLVLLTAPAAGLVDGKALRESLRAYRVLLYGLGTSRDDTLKSRALDEGEDLLHRCCALLHQKGILYRLRADLNSISAE